MAKDIVRRLERILSRQLLFCHDNTIEPMDPYSFVDHEYGGYYFAYLLTDPRHAARKTISESVSRSKDPIRDFSPPLLKLVAFLQQLDVFIFKGGNVRVRNYIT
jgi:hypothetical protein